jgi:cell division protein FtsB
VQGRAVPDATFQPPDQGQRSHGFFGGKKELEAEVQQLRQQLAALGVVERDALRRELEQLRAELPALRFEQNTLVAEVQPLRAEVAVIRQEQSQAAALRTELQQLHATKAALEGSVAQLQPIVQQANQARAELAELGRQVIETREIAILQEVGIYEYRHPLDGSPAYKARLVGITSRIKDAAKAGNAVAGSTTWTVNGSAREGAKMVREFSKLMLRAYNNEAESSVHAMKPYTLESAVARLEKARATIVNLGGTMNIRVTDSYHKLRVEELELTADYLAKVAEEKERDRQEREKRREEEIALREFQREQEKLQKEQFHLESRIEALRNEGNHDAVGEAEAKLAEIRDAIDGITRRAANIRAGHVYIISNVGAFGPNTVKIGMTRRLDPMDRVHELGNASVPFRYDVHAMVSSDDAVGLETYLHHALADRRVNLANMRREFFRAHPSEVKAILEQRGEVVLHWEEEPEALEWRQSETARRESSQV